MYSVKFYARLIINTYKIIIGIFWLTLKIGFLTVFKFVKACKKKHLLMNFVKSKKKRQNNFNIELNKVYFFCLIIRRFYHVWF